MDCLLSQYWRITKNWAYLKLVSLLIQLSELGNSQSAQNRFWNLPGHRIKQADANFLSAWLQNTRKFAELGWFNILHQRAHKTLARKLAAKLDNMCSVPRAYMIKREKALACALSPQPTKYINKRKIIKNTIQHYHKPGQPCRPTVMEWKFIYIMRPFKVHIPAVLTCLSLGDTVFKSLNLSACSHV